MPATIWAERSPCERQRLGVGQGFLRQAGKASPQQHQRGQSALSFERAHGADESPLSGGRCRIKPAFDPWRNGSLTVRATESEERLLLLPFLAADGQARVTAQRAEHHELAAASPQPVHAGVAQDLPAMGALMRRARLGMAGTNEGAIGQDHRRRRAREIELGNGDVTSVVSTSSSISPRCRVWPADSLASLMRSASTKVPLAESQSRTHDAIIGEHEFAMRGRHCGMLDLEIVLRAAPQSVDSQVEFNHPLANLGGFND